jgi:uncharacterized SAM-binding protein YcdF (DUF218 family)
MAMVLVLNVGVGTVATVTLATRALFVSPDTDAPGVADAVVVLSGDYGDRFASALALMDRRVAPTLVHVGDPDFAAVEDRCETKQAFEVVCLRPRPDSTRAEARALARLVSQRRWRSVVVVTSLPHVTRTRLLFDRCVEGVVRVVGSQPPPQARGRRTLIHEWLGFLYAQTIARRC